MTDHRRSSAGRKPGRALVPTSGKRTLPRIYLPETRRAVSQVYLCENGADSVGSRVKCLVSTCLAGAVGLGIIGVAISGSLDLDTSNGIMASLQRASAAAMRPIRFAPAEGDRQQVAGQKSDLIEATEQGLTTRQIIQDTVVQKRGDSEYISIKPYARIVARLATAKPDDVSEIPKFDPFHLYADENSGGKGDTDGDGIANAGVTTAIVDLPAGVLPVEDGISMGPRQVAALIAEDAATFTDTLASVGPVSMKPGILPDDGAAPLIVNAAYRPDAPAEAAQPPRNTTVISKHVIDDGTIPGSQAKSVIIGRGDTLAGILTDEGTTSAQAKAIATAMKPIYSPTALHPGQELRLLFAPDPDSEGDMELVKISLMSGKEHEVTIARSDTDDYVASDEPIDLAAANTMRTAQQESDRASYYTSIYNAALGQHLNEDTIDKILRVISYDVDFKKPVRSGDKIEMFFELQDSGEARDAKPGALLYTAYDIGGERHKFYRFRSADGIVDYYDTDGNSAKKFLMRKPVKNARFSSGFGMRRHPVLGHARMHTGVDWAAPSGTPIHAAGEGVIELSGRRGGYGNQVEIKHANGFETAYGHMSRIAAGIKPGVHVKQGQVIGYVGSTGLSTGPHCHFEILVNHKFVNPMTIHVPRGRQLAGAQLAGFHREEARIENLMQRAPVTTQVASITASNQNAR